jgi:hypothetical protein
MYKRAAVPGTKYRFKYPKAGEANSMVGLHCTTWRRRQPRIPWAADEADIYLPRFGFTAQDDDLWFMR